MSVEVRNLTKVFEEQRAVDDVSFSIGSGEIVGFLGPNGAGKSTTMRILACYLPQTSGSAFVQGLDVTEKNLEVRKQVGYLPEHNPLYPDMYVREYLEFVARLHRLGKQAGQRVEDMIDLTGLGSEQHKKIGQLSKGYRQRVGLAQAMIHDPAVLILDEPTSGLDPNQLNEIRQVIREAGKNKTVILSTHIMQEVQAICDRALIINKGKLVADDSVSELGARLNRQIITRVAFRESVEAGLLQKIPGVLKAEAEGGNRWKLFSAEDMDIREAVFRFAVERGLTLLTLYREQQNLEEIFRLLTTETEE